MSRFIAWLTAKYDSVISRLYRKSFRRRVEKSAEILKEIFRLAQKNREADEYFGITSTDPCPAIRKSGVPDAYYEACKKTAQRNRALDILKIGSPALVVNAYKCLGIIDTVEEPPSQRVETPSIIDPKNSRKIRRVIPDFPAKNVSVKGWDSQRKLGMKEEAISIPMEDAPFELQENHKILEEVERKFTELQEKNPCKLDVEKAKEAGLAPPAQKPEEVDIFKLLKKAAKNRDKKIDGEV